MTQLSIGILAVYFGRLPAYFPVWLESCRKNPTIDFLLVTDQEVNHDVPNVKVIPSTMEQVRERASQMLGFAATLSTPFKLCDYKPTYGLLFEDLVGQYDYWGHCDVDLIWGDLRSFFQRYQLEQYDKFLPLGHLCLYRNTPENNRRFMEKAEPFSDYRKIFREEPNYLLDELAVNHIYKNQYPFFDKIVFADIWPGKRRYTMCTQLSYYPSIYEEFCQRCKPVNFKRQVFLWENGKIWQYYQENGRNGAREFLYIHIQKRKWALEGEFADRMVISNGIVKALTSEEQDVGQLIDRYNPYSWVADGYDDVEEFVLHCWSYFKRKIIKTEKTKVIVEKG